MGSQRIGATFTTHNKSIEHTKAKSVHTNLGVFYTAPSQGECSLQKTWTDPALPERESNNNNKETRQTATNRKKKPGQGWFLPVIHSSLPSWQIAFANQWGKDSVPMMAQRKTSRLTWYQLCPPFLQPREPPSYADWACGPRGGKQLFQTMQIYCSTLTGFTADLASSTTHIQLCQPPKSPLKGWTSPTLFLP